MNREEFQKRRTEIISEMLDNPDRGGIYPTTDCYDQLDDLFDEIVKNCSTSDVMHRFSDDEIDDFAHKWASDRSVGDAEQDSEAFYDYTQGMREMQRKLLNGA